MPNVNDFIQIDVTIESTSPQATSWGVPVILGLQETGDGAFAGSADKLGVLTPYYSSAQVLEDHGDGTLYKAAVSCFAQGVKKLYAYALDIADLTTFIPTGTEITTALTGTDIKNYVADGTIGGVCLAAMYNESQLTALKDFADDYNVIFTASNLPNGDSSASLDSASAIMSAIASRNGFFIYIPEVDDEMDGAAAALGLLMCLEPWASPFMKALSLPVTKFLVPSLVTTAEDTYKMNTVSKIGTVIRLTNGLTTIGGTDKFIDIPRTQYYAVKLIRAAVLKLRISAKKIPYTEAGLETVKTTIMGAMESLLRVGAISEYTVQMPEFESIDASDRAARVLKNVLISCQLAGDIHEFNMSLTMEV